MIKLLMIYIYIFVFLWISNSYSYQLREEKSAFVNRDEQYHIPKKLNKGTERLAFLLGNSSAVGLKKLQYVRNDLGSMRKTLTAFCSFDEKNIISRYNAKPDEIVFIFDSLYDFYSNSPTEAMFLFYYSGHADKDNLLMGENKFSFFRLKRSLQSLPFKINIYIIDACHSGGFSLKGSSPDSSFLPVQMKHIMESSVEGNVLIYSSTIQQKSYESSRYKNSIFTYHFISALQGAADYSKDYRISLDEAYTYAFKNTVSENDSLIYQRPGRQVDIRGEGDIILAQMHTFTSGVSLDKSINGKLLIIDKYGKLVGEIYKDIGNKLMYALRAGKYKIINIKEKSSFFTKVRITKKGFTLINRPDLTRKLNTDIKLGITLAGAATNLLSEKLSTLSPQGGIELIFRNHVQMYLNAGFVKIKNVTKNPNLSKQIDEISGMSGQLGLGYSFKPNFINKFWFQSGIDLIYLKNRISYESVQEVTTTPYEASNLIIIPHVKVSYNYPVSPLIKIGLSLMYHPAVDLRDINKKSGKTFQMDYSNFMSNGVDIGLMVTYMPPRFRGY